MYHGILRISYSLCFPFKFLRYIADYHSLLVLWAQRSDADDETKNVVYLTITAPDIPKESLKLELTSTKLTFSGENKSRIYAVELEFFAEIDEKLSTTHHSGRGVEFVLRKKEAKAEYWPRLVKEAKKLQFIKTDFDKVGFPVYLSLYST